MDLSSVVAFAVIVSMIAIIVYSESVVSSGKASRLRKYALYFILFMMATMFIGIGWYLSVPHSFLTAIIAINIVMIPMIAFLVLLFFFYSLETPLRVTYDRFIFPSFYLLNELFMTYFVFIILGIKLSGSVFTDLPTMVNSLVFVVPMEVEMIFSIALFRIRGTIGYLLVVLALMDLLSPALFVHHTTFLLVTNSLIMVGGMILLLEEVSSSKRKILSDKKKIIDISILIYLLNSFGFFLEYSTGGVAESSWFPYSISILVGMFLYFFFIFSGRKPSTVDSWEKKRRWLFFLLLGTFASEFLMSIPLDLAAGFFQTRGYGIGSIAYLVSNAGGTGGAFHFGSVLLSIIPFIAIVANAPMFLLLMGIEMGALVVLRMKNIKWLEKRVNLSFALVAYFTYTLYGPNYIMGWSKLPLWANVGALGPVRADLILPLILSYAIYAVLAILFGRRSYCGTLCPSAVMYGGTLGQEMISLNYSSKTSRKNIGSRYSSFVRKVIGGSWIFMLASAVASFAISIRLINLPFDPAILYSYLIWNLLWYAFFISIPFVGMSPCRRYGWCTTGTFVGFFSRLGFFKIKAIDPAVCARCPTKDCVTACEVGLGDLPAQFMKNGYFKSQKCVGSGSCIEACPYDNIHFYDIRNVIRDRSAAKRPDAQ
ncbi:MAG: 4Fe-4S binding protein [Candidatus Thermoplasmatota archaeon]|nr:4Fe-4S binding protein [Candidatus Thermoplasmatota archaeon]MCL5789020.1 4Fe-4S binding protein [Candidatus Thermoplasmatota archaeon]